MTCPTCQDTGRVPERDYFDWIDVMTYCDCPEGKKRQAEDAQEGGE